MSVYFYILTFIKDGELKKYVGQTQDIEKRIKRHLKDLSIGKHHNQNLQKFYNEGGRFTGLPTIIDLPDRQLAYQIEQSYIWSNRENPVFVNIECGNDTFTNNPRKEEIEIKIRSHLTNWRDNLTPTQRREQNLKLRGEGNGMFGKRHTEETRQIIRERVNKRYSDHGSPIKGVKKSLDHRAKISKIASERLGPLNPFFGKSHTESTKIKIAYANRGRLPPNMRKVSVYGTEYMSITEAGRQLGVHTTVVLHRVKSHNPKFSDWKWI